MEEAGLTLGVVCIAGAGAAFFGLRKRLPARVGCWFCGEKRWVPFRERDSWACPKCDQYNGFTQDGDYNVPPDTRTQRRVAFAERGHFSPASNGLCRKCNSNQHLKILQLASFKPTSEKKFDVEIESFRSHLEKIYKLCSKCRNNLKCKLSSEKALHLKTKHAYSRIINKDTSKPLNWGHIIGNFLLSAIKAVTIVSLLIVLLNICLHLNLFLSKNVMTSTKNHFYNMYEGMKSTFLDHCNAYTTCKTMTDNLHKNYLNISMEISNASIQLLQLREKYVNWKYLQVLDAHVAMQILSVAGLIFQLLLHIFQLSFSYRSLCINLIRGLTIYNAKVNTRYLLPLQFILLLILLLSLPKNSNKKEEPSKKKLKKLADTSISQSDDDSDDLLSNDSDSECYMSVRSAGAHPGKPAHFPPSYFNTNCQYPQYSNLYYPFQKLDTSVNSDYNSCYGGSLLNHSFNANSKCYDCELDRSINDLNLGYRRIRNKDNPLVFSTKRYDTSSPNLFSPPSLLQNKFILSPSRLIHGTQQSWVAGGYWGVDSPRKIYQNGERSSTSSQSSGFESQTSSVRRRNINSFPPSRDGSVCSDYEKKSEGDYGNVFGRPQIVHRQSQGFQPLQSPVFPSMKQNESVFIPNMSYESFLLNGSKRV